MNQDWKLTLKLSAKFHSSLNIAFSIIVRKANLIEVLVNIMGVFLAEENLVFRPVQCILYNYILVRNGVVLVDKTWM